LEAEESTVATALLGERHAPAGAFACVREGAPFTKRERLAIAHAGRLLGSSLAARNALIGERTRAEELLACSHRDETTGIPNRRALLAWLDELDPTVSLAVLLADFDGLRSVNNELGPDRGDELIRHVATAIQQSTRPGELAARLHGSGGDEFVVCCPHHDAGQAAARATQLEHQLSAVLLPGDLARLYRGASVGTSVRRPGEDPMAFLERAAASMRERKGIRKAAVS
jgi:diguanylate cyclase (GGDEF)-like protein